MTEDPEKARGAPAAALRHRLAAHGFSRSELVPEAVGLLIGNAELGGLVRADGLGFDELWASDLWHDPLLRASLCGPSLRLSDGLGDAPFNGSYRQALSLEDGVVRTEVWSEGGRGYVAEVFCSMAQRRLVRIRVENRSSAVIEPLRLTLPIASYHPSTYDRTGSEASQVDAFEIRGRSRYPIEFTTYGWYLRSSLPLRLADDRDEAVMEVPPGAAVEVTLALVTEWGSATFDDDARAMARSASPHAVALAESRMAWSDDWSRLGFVSLPDASLERLYYRSVFWLLATSGSSRFLPGECQFAKPAFDMHPFSYGYAGWAVQALQTLGHKARSRLMLEQFFRPAALERNAAAALAKHGKIGHGFAFAHEQDTNGDLRPAAHWWLQHHVQAFAGAAFHRHSRLYPDVDWEQARTYEVLRGTADFWASLVEWSDEHRGFVLPPILSVSEDLFERSVLDGVLSAKWALAAAARCAARLGRDPDREARWRRIEDDLIVPQDAEVYLEYLGDDSHRLGGGYHGIRAPLYLGYPTAELLPQLDAAKVDRTLARVWARNRGGEGMISFVATWFALTEASIGNGDRALRDLSICDRYLDPSGTAVCEVPGTNPYFHTATASFIVAIVHLLLQSRDGEIHAFPAVPSAWTELRFYDLPAEGGVRVSGEMVGGKIRSVEVSAAGRGVHRGTESRLSIETLRFR